MRRAVLNRLINEEQAEQGDGGYLTRLSKGQLECRTELADLAERCDVTITEVRLVLLVHLACITEVVTVTEVRLFGMRMHIRVRRWPLPLCASYILRCRSSTWRCVRRPVCAPWAAQCSTAAPRPEAKGRGPGLRADRGTRSPGGWVYEVP